MAELRNSWYAGNTSSDEWKSGEAALAQVEQEYKDIHADAIRWESKSGHAIEVLVVDGVILVSVDGHGQEEVQFSELPAKQAEAYKAAGIVAKLGSVGVTAEQKAVIEARM